MGSDYTISSEAWVQPLTHWLFYVFNNVLSFPLFLSITYCYHNVSTTRPFINATDNISQYKGIYADPISIICCPIHVFKLSFIARRPSNTPDSLLRVISTLYLQNWLYRILYACASPVVLKENCGSRCVLWRWNRSGKEDCTFLVAAEWQEDLKVNVFMWNYKKVKYNEKRLSVVLDEWNSGFQSNSKTRK